jgi:hypothetical protein
MLLLIYVSFSIVIGNFSKCYHLVCLFSAINKSTCIFYSHCLYAVKWGIEGSNLLTFIYY